MRKFEISEFNTGAVVTTIPFCCANKSILLAIIYGLLSFIYSFLTK